MLALHSPDSPDIDTVARTATALVPHQRTPLRESLRRLLPSPDPTPPPDLERVLAELSKVAVWTSRDGAWQEHASFLLGDRDGRWRVVPFNDPSTARLIPRLRALPGFDSDLLLELIGSHTERIDVLWASGQRT